MNRALICYHFRYEWSYWTVNVQSAREAEHDKKFTRNNRYLSKHFQMGLRPTRTYMSRRTTSSMCCWVCRLVAIHASGPFTKQAWTDMLQWRRESSFLEMKIYHQCGYFFIRKISMKFLYRTNVWCKGITTTERNR